MTIKETIMADIKTAMKAGNQAELTTLRGLSSVLKNAEIAKQLKAGASATLTDDEMMSALMTEAKKRKDAIASFNAGGRADLAEGEQKELVIVMRYLPAQMSAEEARTAVENIIARVGAKDLPSAMKAVMAELRGKADSALVAEEIKKRFAK